MEQPDKDQIEYEEEIREHLVGWYKMNRSRLTVGAIFSLVGYIVLYVILVFLKGKNFANEYILEIVITLIALEGIGFIGYVFWLAYRKIPANIDKEKNQKIEELKTKIPEQKSNPPKFYVRSYWADFIIKDSNADKVADYLFQFLDDTPYIIDESSFSITTKGGNYYSPEIHGTKNRVFVAAGEKTSFNKVITGTNNLQGSFKLMPEMYLVYVVQGGQNTTLVKFHTDDKDVFNIFSKIFNKELRKVFFVESVEGLPEEPEIVFSNLLVHRELSIEKATIEQVMGYIKTSISSTLWYLHRDNRIAYDVDRSQTKFYDPQKNNTSFYGIVFTGIKYDLEQREGGILNRKRGEKIPNLFTISLSSAGLGDKTKILLKFDTQIQDVEGFYGEWVKKELKKVFIIKEKRESRIL